MRQLPCWLHNARAWVLNHSPKRFQQLRERRAWARLEARLTERRIEMYADAMLKSLKDVLNAKN